MLQNRKQPTHHDILLYYLDTLSSSFSSRKIKLKNTLIHQSMQDKFYSLLVAGTHRQSRA